MALEINAKLMNQDELNKQIQEHHAWLEDNRSGMQFLLRDATLSRLDFTDVLLAGAIFERVRFDHCALRGVGFGQAEMTGVAFLDSDLSGAKFFEGHFQNVKFTRCKRMGASLAGVIGDSCNFSGINLDSAVFPKSTFNRSSFASASLRKANMLKFVLNGGDFSNSDLAGTNLTKTEFVDVDLRGAIFRDAVLLKTDFKRVHAYGITGPLGSIEKCRVTEPDFSEKGDGSKIGTLEEFFSLLQVGLAHPV